MIVKVAATSKREDFNAVEVNKDLLTLINKEREKHGREQMTSPEALNTLASVRSKQIVTNYSHYDKAGNNISWESI